MNPQQANAVKSDTLFFDLGAMLPWVMERVASQPVMIMQKGYEALIGAHASLNIKYDSEKS